LSGDEQNFEINILEMRFVNRTKTQTSGDAATYSLAENQNKTVHTTTTTPLQRPRKMPALVQYPDQAQGPYHVADKEEYLAIGG
jgi:hypothetical protein